MEDAYGPQITPPHLDHHAALKYLWSIQKLAKHFSPIPAHRCFYRASLLNRSLSLVKFIVAEMLNRALISVPTSLLIDRLPTQLSGGFRWICFIIAFHANASGGIEAVFKCRTDIQIGWKP
jgi:hypothetical protein